MSPLEIGAILLAGLGAGTINAVVGSGTLITFPTLLAFGVSPVTANVSNTVGLVPGSVSGALGYRRELSGQRGRDPAARCRVAGRRRARRRPPAGAARGRVLGHRPRADRPRLCAGGVPAADLGVGRATPRGDRRGPGARCLVGLARRAARRGVRRLLRSRPGRAADGDHGHRRRRDPPTAQRRQERPRHHRQRRGRARVHRRRRRGLGGRRPDRRGVRGGRPAGGGVRHAGCRPRPCGP